ncbi:MAG: tetratricopeptide repeat protein [Pyrinomonadaceae bacterium]
MQTTTRWRKIVSASTMFLLLIFSTATLLAQKTDNYISERDRAVQLVNNKKFAEALPLLEKLAADKRADKDVFVGLGLTAWQLQDTIKDQKEWKQMRLKARNAFLKAKELGVVVPEIDLIIGSIKPDGGDKNRSDNPQAQAAHDEAFQAFAAGNYKKAAADYEKAATLDPTHYEAALYTGNSYYALKDYDKAGIWFAKAIALDPNREIAHRYWADGLTLSGNNKAAEDKYLDAIIAEPYSSSAWRGLIQYAQNNSIKLAHPKIDIPVDFSSSGDGNTKITLGNLMSDKNDDGSFAWTTYGLSRAAWQTDKNGKLSKEFSKAYPNEKVYRRSLMEEMDALHTVLTVLKESKDVKKLNPALATLKKLNDEGLLESFILFVRADAGIKQDYPAYRQNNRDKLKRYLLEYVMKNGGN